MHEFSLCEGIIRQVTAAQPHKKQQIKTVNVAIGELAGVDIDSLKFWFPVVAKKMNLPNLNLVIETIKSVVKCQSCNHQFRLKNYLTPCPKCNAYANYTFICGRELIVKSIVL